MSAWARLTLVVVTIGAVPVALPASLEAVAPAITASIEARTVRIGDRITLDIGSQCGVEIVGVEHREGEQLEAFEVRAVRLSRAPDAAGCGTAWTVELSTLETGSLRIPPLGVRYRVVGGTATAVARTEARRVTVTAPAVDATGDIRPLKLRAVVSQAVPFGTLVLVLGMSLALAAAWALVKRRAAVQPASRGTNIAALCEEIRGMERVVPTTDAETRAFYLRLSWLFRRGLEAQWRVPALTVSSSEMLALVRSTSATPLVPILASLVESIDTVKFGGEVPPGTECGSVVRTAHQLLSEGRPGAA